MYKINKYDEVIEIKSIPQSSIGAPLPTILASENNLYLIYYLEETLESWDGKSIRMITVNSEGESLVIITFNRIYTHLFGPPNDEAISGHPLFNRGLKSYSAYEIKNSSWIKELEKMNSIHPQHNKENFIKDKRHFIFTFHDSTFECIAKDLQFDIYKGSIKSAALYLSGLIE